MFLYPLFLRAERLLAVLLFFLFTGGFMGQIKDTLSKLEAYLKYDKTKRRYYLFNLPPDTHTLIRCLDVVFPHKTPTPDDIKDSISLSAKSGKRELIDMLLNMIRGG
jgi:hypothetical protein